MDCDRCDIRYREGCCSTKLCRNLLIDRLAAYEDTGLTPEEIKEDMPDVRRIEEKLVAYEDAEEQGLLVHLPCAVGSPYYTVEKFCNEGDEDAELERHWGSDCEYCCIQCNAELRVVENRWVSEAQILNSRKCIGTIIHLSREEAEAALEKEETK